MLTSCLCSCHPSTCLRACFMVLFRSRPVAHVFAFGIPHIFQCARSCVTMRTFVFSSSLNHVAVCLCVLVLACIAPHHHIHPFTSQHCAGSCFAACAGCTISSGSSLHPRPPSFRHPFLLISGGGQCSIVVPPILTRYRLWVEIGFIESVSKCIHSSILSQA